MLLTVLAASLMMQAADTVPTYDSPETRALVERTVLASGELPAELQDYRASVRSSLFITLSPDTLAGEDLPASADDLVSEVRWSREGNLQQRVRGHRTRLLVPIPYTLATILEQPWVIPHLYGSDIFTPFAAVRAVNPFGHRGPQYYRYTADDPIRIRVQGELITLIPVEVRPREIPSDDRTQLVIGTFFLDSDRGAVARARFGFAGRGGGIPRTMGRIDTYLELENGLWEGRYWLPFQQRREIQFESRLLGTSVTARVINRFVDFELNTGWEPTGERIQLVWADEGSAAFAGWGSEVGADAGAYSSSDFADLRLATAVERSGGDRWRAQPHYARGSHLFRYNRVEGPYVGIGGRLVPPRPRENRFELYGTAGWAFAESTPRGELNARWGSAVAPRPDAGFDPGVDAAVYRRLRDLQAFRPTFEWDWIYTLPSLLWGSDVRDYYDAAGAELFASARHGRWSGRIGGRFEKHDSVQVNTGRYLFGNANDFGPLASIDPGRHAALEAGAEYSFGPGAFGMGNSLVARADTELGVGDFSFTRITGLLSLRYGLGPLTLAARADAGHATGDVPPQRLFRFGSLEGLRGYAANEFGGSSAALLRSRLLIGIPPRSTRPLARVGLFLIPPLRPSLVLLAETGWTQIEADLLDELLRIRARPTDGVRSSVGFGVSFLDDAFTIERLQPVGETDGADARWYVGLTYWY